MDLLDLKKDIQNAEVLGNKKVGYSRPWKQILEKYNFKVICEVGVEEGRSFKQMLESNPIKAAAIDCWMDDGVRSRNHFLKTQTEMDLMYEKFKKEMEGKPFVKVIRDYSFNAVKQFPDEHFDLVYIDADHTYEACLRDIRDWYPKVKKGGVLTGDDYRVANFKGSIKFGVIEAVNTFIEEKCLEVIEFPRFGWAIIKYDS